MNNQPPTNRDKLRDTIVNLRQQRDAHQMDESDYIDRVMAEVENDKQKWLRFFAEDIAQCFIPKCSRCNRRATEQTTKGKYAQENLHRPVNWGYYCKKHADEGRELEREAMYG